MALDQTTFRSILVQVLSIDEEFIVPKQGNWFNPQDIQKSPNKPDVWVAFKIGQAKGVNVPMLMFTDDTKTSMSSVSWYISKCDIQFLGKRAEELAQSVAHWVHRSDVKNAFRANNAEFMACEAGYRVDSYYQDGLNTNLAYRVTIKVLHSSAIETTQERWLTEIPTGGLFV
jgi:hypothetical protein